MEIGKIKQFIKIDFKKIDKIIKKELKKNTHFVIVNKWKYKNIEEFESAYQMGAINNISEKHYNKIIEKLTPIKNENIEELEKIKKFLKYYTDYETIQDLYNWYKKNILK